MNGYSKAGILSYQDLGLRVQYTWRERLTQLLVRWKLLPPPPPPKMDTDPFLFLMVDNTSEWLKTTPLKGNFATQRSTTPTGNDKERRTEFFE